MNIVERSIRLPVTVTVIVALVVIFGLIGLRFTPIQLTPNVDQPVISVTTNWFGASPAEMVREVAEEQEEVLKSVSGLIEMSSTNSEGQTQIRLQFAVGVDKEAALNEVRDKLRQVPDYPPDVDEPVIEAVDPDNRDYIAWMLLYQREPVGASGPPAPGYNGDIAALGDFLDDNVKPVLERADGVEQIRIFGGREREMQVRVDMQALAARGLTIEQLVSRLRDENADVTAGTVAEGKNETSVRVIGQYGNPDEISSTVISYSSAGTPIYVRDVARVVMDFKKEVSFVRSMGEPVVAIAAQRAVGANVLETMEQLQTQIRAVNENILKPTNWGIEVEQVYDQTIYIYDALQKARNNLLLGAVLAGAVLFLTLRSLGATTVVMVSIPVSVIGTFLGLWLTGRNINVISMAGLTFAVGMGIDNAIVVLENIFRHREMGKDRVRAAVDGAKEVWGAILAATLTNVVVFLPIVFIQEEAGQLFRDISVALTISFFLYLFVSPTVIPMLATWFLRKMPASMKSKEGEARPQTRLGRLTRPIGRLEERLSQMFYRLVLWLTGGVVRRLALVIVLIAASVIGSILLMPPRDYLPPGNQNLIFGILAPPPGYSRQEFRGMAEKVEGFLRPWWQVGPRAGDSPEALEQKRQQLAKMQAGWRAAMDAQAIPGMQKQVDDAYAAVQAGKMTREQADKSTEQLRATISELKLAAPPPAIENFFFVNFGNFVFMGAKAYHEDADRVKSLSYLMNGSLQGIPGTFGFFMQMPIFRTDRFGQGLTINVSGPDNNKVLQAAGLMQYTLMQAFDTFPQSDPQNFNIGRPEVQITPDRVRAAAAGVLPSAIRSVSQVAIDGEIVGDYRYLGRSIDLAVVTDKPRQQQRTEDLANVPLATQTGQIVPLGSVANFLVTSAPQQINRIEEQPSVSFNIQLPESLTIQQATETVESKVAELRSAGMIGPDLRIETAGSANKLREFMLAFLPGFVLATIVNYLLMASLFESWLHPFVIIMSVPFALVGGFAGLAVLHACVPEIKLDVLTMLGFVILVGTIVNMPILIVHQALNNIAAGMERNHAIALSTQTRVRPIFMSVITSVAGMAPLVVFGGAGSELYRGLGSVLVGGLLISTFFTLFLTPTLMSLMLDISEGFRRLFRGGRGSDAGSNGRGDTTPTARRLDAEVAEAPVA